MSHKGKTNTNHLIKGKNLFKGGAKASPIEVSTQDGKITTRKVSHLRKGFVYHETKGWKKAWQSHQNILMASLLLRFGIVPV